MVAGVDRRQQMLAAILDPAHRMVELEASAASTTSSGESRALMPKPPPTSGAKTRMPPLLEREHLGQAEAHVCGTWVEP